MHDGRIDGQFRLEQGSLIQGVKDELGLTNSECNQISYSIWTQIFKEFDNPENITVANNNNVTPNADNNYLVYKDAVVKFSKECWARVVNLINNVLNKNIEIEEPLDDESDVDDLRCDNQGRKEVESFKDEDGKTYITKYSYDESGNVCKEVTLSPDDKNYYSERNYQYIFDEDGNCSSMKVKYKKSPNDINPATETFYYDVDESIPHYNADADEAVAKTEIFYLENGYKIEQHYEKGENITNRIDYNVPNVSIMYDETGNIFKITEYTFDENGAISGIKVTDNKGNIILEEDNFDVDGEFHISLQGETGDCYLLASINTFSATDKGLEILRNNVEYDEHNKTYTVSFPGSKIARENMIKNGIPENKCYIQEKYTITEQELEDAAVSFKYSKGDKDVLLYEIAYEKYRQDAAKTASENNIDCSTKYVQGLYGGSPEHSGSNLDDGPGAEVFFMLTGQTSQTYERYNNEVHTGFIIDSQNMQMTFSNTENNNYVNPNQNNYLSDDKTAIQNMNLVTDFSSEDKQFDNIMQNIIEETKLYGQAESFSTCSLYVVQGEDENEYMLHQFRIVSATNDVVTLVNPWDTSQEITVSMEEFKTSLFDLTIGKYSEIYLAQN